MKYTGEEEKTIEKNRGKILVRIIVPIGLIVGGLLIYQYRTALSTKIGKVFAASESEPIPVTDLHRQHFLFTVPANGEIVGLETTSVAAPQTSRGSLTLAWLIPEGSFVQPGDTVVRFDGTDAELSLETQQNNLRENDLNTQITTLNQDTDARVLGMDRTDAEMEYEYAMTVMPEDESIFSKWDIITAQADANYAKERISFLDSKEKSQRRVARSDQQLLTIERNRAQSEVDIIQNTLNSLELKATAPGLVLYKRDRRNEDPQIGDEYQSGQDLMELVNLNILQARIYVLERDGGNLEKGLPVVLKLDAIPDKEFHGTISSLSSVAGQIERDSVLRYFTCDVAITDAGGDLKRIRPGMSLEADVVLEEYDSCFIVPSSAVTIENNKSIVYVEKGEQKFEPREVEMGLGAHGEAAILDGIEEGEKIALQNPNGTRQLYLPDFSKGATSDQDMMRMMRGRGGMDPGMMRRMMGGGGPPRRR